jgi:hypothetical protein
MSLIIGKLLVQEGTKEFYISGYGTTKAAVQEMIEKKIMSCLEDGSLSFKVIGDKIKYEKLK